MTDAEPFLDRLRAACRQWLSAHERLRTRVRVTPVWGWVATVVAAGALTTPAGRRVAMQLGWSLLAMGLVWVLARTKTLTLRATGTLFLVGALVCAPVVLAVSAFAYLLVDGPTASWSVVGFSPLLEELVKLVPVLLFLAGTRRAGTLGLADHAVLGAAVGAGFSWTEGSLARIADLWGNLPGYAAGVQWGVWPLWPGHFTDALANRTFAGHVAGTALVSLGIGLAERYRQGSDSERPRLLPGLLLALVVFDHAAFNGRGVLASWVLSVHNALGAGGVVAPLLAVLLLTAVVLDYRALNRLVPAIPTYSIERKVTPWGELRVLVASACGGLPAVAHVLEFLRERRRLGNRLQADPESREPAVVDLTERLGWHRRQVALLVGASLTVTALCLGAAAGGGAFPTGAASWGTASVAGMLAAMLDADRVDAMGALAAALTVPALAGAALCAWTRRLRVPDQAEPEAYEEPVRVAEPTTRAETQDLFDGFEAQSLLRRPSADQGHAHGRAGAGSALAWVRTHAPSDVAGQAAAAVADAALRRVPALPSSRHLAMGATPRTRQRGLDVERVFSGFLDARGEVTGLHHVGPSAGQPDERAPKLLERTVDPDPVGVYRAFAEIYDDVADQWVARTAPASFFPEDWPAGRVVDEIRRTVETGTTRWGRWWGESPGGALLRGYIDARGDVVAAFPSPRVVPGTAPMTIDARFRHDAHGLPHAELPAHRLVAWWMEDDLQDDLGWCDRVIDTIDDLLEGRVDAARRLTGNAFTLTLSRSEAHVELAVPGMGDEVETLALTTLRELVDAWARFLNQSARHDAAGDADAGDANASQATADEPGGADLPLAIPASTEERRPNLRIVRGEKD